MNKYLKSLENKLDSIIWSSEEDRKLFLGWLVFAQFAHKIKSPYIVVSNNGYTKHISNILSSLIVKNEFVFNEKTTESVFRKTMSNNFTPFVLENFRNKSCFGFFNSMYDASGSKIYHFRKEYNLNSSGAFITEESFQLREWFENRSFTLELDRCPLKIDFSNDELDSLYTLSSDANISKFKDIEYAIRELLFDKSNNSMLLDKSATFIASYCLFKDISKDDFKQTIEEFKYIFN